MHSVIFNFNDFVDNGKNDFSQKDTKYTDDKIYEMMSEQRKLDGVREITDTKELRDVMTFFEMYTHIDSRHVEIKDDGIVIHMPYDTLIDVMYQACDDLGEYWFMNDGYEMVTAKDYFRILLLNHMGEEEFDMKLVQVWDFHY